MLERREHQILEMPQCVWADCALLVIPNQPAKLGLVLEYTEMVRPEPDHLFLQLRRRVHGAQQITPGGLVCEAIAALIQCLSRLLLAHIVLDFVDVLPLLVHASNLLDRIDMGDLHGVDLGADRGGQGGIAHSQLCVQESLAPEPAVRLHAVAVDAEVHALEPLDVVVG